MFGAVANGFLPCRKHFTYGASGCRMKVSLLSLEVTE